MVMAVGRLDLTLFYRHEVWRRWISAGGAPAADPAAGAGPGTYCFGYW